MESFEMFGLPRTIRAGLRLLFKNSFLHEVSDDEIREFPATSRSRSAPPKLACRFELKSDSYGTTLMVRNIPTKFTQMTFLEVIATEFDVSTIDFFYLPLDFKSGKSLGYCFINFCSSIESSDFRQRFERKRLNPKSNKILEITVAKVQGFQKNYNLFSTSSVMTMAHPEFRPMMKCPDCDVLRPLASPYDAIAGLVMCPVCK